MTELVFYPPDTKPSELPNFEYQEFLVRFKYPEESGVQYPFYRVHSYSRERGWRGVEEAMKQYIVCWAELPGTTPYDRF